jgi:hypothetical protein
VHSTDGVDEISTAAPTNCWEVSGDPLQISEYTISPADFGVDSHPLEEVRYFYHDGVLFCQVFVAHCFDLSSWHMLLVLSSRRASTHTASMSHTSCCLVWPQPSESCVTTLLLRVPITTNPVKLRVKLL